MRTRAARLYVSPRTRPLTAEEQETRRTAYALKTADPEALAVAAVEMARLIDGPCCWSPYRPAAAASRRIWPLRWRLGITHPARG